MSPRRSESRAGLGASPRVFIGLPVYNGQNYLGPTVRSILAQSYGDLRILIADNASTDETQEIARGLVASDYRVSYHRHDRNIGWVRNHMFVLDRCDEPLFKWAAHDDPLGPDFLRECVGALLARPECASAFSRVVEIDDQGRRGRALDEYALVSGQRPRDRVRWAISTEYMTEIFAVGHTRAMKACAPMAGYIATDRVFLAELLLQGDMAVTDGCHFFRRFHEGAYSFNWSERSKAERLAQLDPDSRWPYSLMRVRRVSAYLRAFRRAPIPWAERVACAAVLLERPFAKIAARRPAPRPAPATPVVAAAPVEPVPASAPGAPESAPTVVHAR